MVLYEGAFPASRHRQRRRGYARETRVERVAVHDDEQDQETLDCCNDLSPLLRQGFGTLSDSLGRTSLEVVRSSDGRTTMGTAFPDGNAPLVPATRNGFAFNPVSRNRHTGKPVDGDGLVIDAAYAKSLMRKQGIFTGSIGGFADRNIAGSSTLSDHAKGEALDVMVGEGNVTAGDRVASWLVANAASLRVDYLQWNWNAWNASEGWHRNRTDNPHTDHVHVSFLE